MCACPRATGCTLDAWSIIMQERFEAVEVDVVLVWGVGIQRVAGCMVLIFIRSLKLKKIPCTDPIGGILALAPAAELLANFPRAAGKKWPIATTPRCLEQTLLEAAIELVGSFRTLPLVL